MQVRAIIENSGQAPCSAASLLPRVLRESGFDQFPHERGGQRFVGLKADRALAGFIVLQVGLVICYGVPAAGEEGAVFRRCSKTHEHFPSMAERWDAVVDVLLGIRYGSADGFAQLLQR